jgi:hypothetical protein
MYRKLVITLGVSGTCLASLIFFISENEIRAQSGSRSSQQYRTQPGSERRIQRPAETTRQRVEQPFEVRFWNWLAQAQYHNWASMPGTTTDVFEGSEPHGAMVKVFANRQATSNPQQLPHGSVLIKENFAPDGKTLKAITVMYRSQGFNPQAGDWYWIKYEPDGQVSQMKGMPVSGKAGMCIDCHSSAGGNDYLFSNDK